MSTLTGSPAFFRSSIASTAGKESRAWCVARRSAGSSWADAARTFARNAKRRASGRDQVSEIRDQTGEIEDQSPGIKDQSSPTPVLWISGLSGSEFYQNLNGIDLSTGLKLLILIHERNGPRIANHQVPATYRPA
jgi:hypothetical protein